MLRHFGRKRKGYVVTHSFSSVALRRTVLQTATWSFPDASAYLRNELVELRNGLRKILLLFPAVDSIESSKHVYTWTFFSLFCFLFHVLYLYLVHILVVSPMENLFDFCICYHLLCRRGNIYFDVHFWLITPVHLLSRDGKVVEYVGKKGLRGVYFPRESAFSNFRY